MRVNLLPSLVVILLFSIAACLAGCPPPTTVDGGGGGDGDGDGDGDDTDAGQGDGDGDGDPDAGPMVMDCGDQCMNGMYSTCTCDPSDPCGWAADAYCDSDCFSVIPNPFDDEADCGPPVPDGWLNCPGEYYDADDGCDCGCGVVDPDCDDGNITSCDFFFCGDEPVVPDDNGTCVVRLDEPDPPDDVFVDAGPNAPVANIDADSNRDGAITVDDDAVEAEFGPAGGAIAVANWDDDDGESGRDHQDLVINGDDDVADLTPIIIRTEANLADTYTARVQVRPGNAALRTRVFLMDDLTGSAGQAILTGQVDPVEIPVAPIRTGEVRLLVEAAAGRSANWDGNLTIRLEYRNDEGLVSVDEVAVRVSPVVFTDNLQTPQTLHVMHITSAMASPNDGLWNPLNTGLPNQDVELYDVSQSEYDFDRWAQDNMQAGYQLMPGATEAHEVKTHMNLARSGGLAFFVVRELTGPDQGYAWPGGAETSHNYGGNLEVLPPYTNGDDDYPLGRMVAGGGEAGSVLGVSNTDRMNMAQTAFLEAQEVQAPVLEVSSEWLIVGHIDEIFQFVPDLSEGAARPYKVMIASTALAKQALQDASDNGNGGLAVFEGRGMYQTTVDGILDDEELMAYQTAVQTRIDTVRMDLADAMGLGDEDFVEVPVLYEFEMYGPLDLAVALNPGIQNLITSGDTLYAPDPEGPDVDGNDVWRVQTQAVTDALGLSVEFVDVFDSYHVLLGEAHCGSNMVRAPYATAWWEAL